MNSRKINISGLVLGFIGVVIVFIWGYPQPDFDPYQSQRLLNTGGPDQELIAKADHYRFMSRVGLSFIGISFVLQAVAACASSLVTERRSYTERDCSNKE